MLWNDWNRMSCSHYCNINLKNGPKMADFSADYINKQPRICILLEVYRYTGKGNISADKWNIGGPDISADLFGPIFFSADISVNRRIDHRQQCCGLSCNE